MANPAPTINQINAFNATQGTIIDFNIIGGTELVRSNRIYIYDLSDNSLICTHLYVSTESIHELPANTDSSIVYESGKSSADFVNGAQYYAQIQTYTDTAGTEGGSGLSVAKMFWCLVDPTLTITTIPSTISTTSYNVSATYTDTNASVVSNIIQQYQFNLYSAGGSLLQSSGVVVGSGTQQGTSTIYDLSYNFTGLNVGSSYYVVVDVTTTQGMSISTQSNTFTVSIDTPTLGEATVVNNACDGYISVTSNLSGEYGGSASGEIASFITNSINDISSLKVNLEPIQDLHGYDKPWVGGAGKNLFDVSYLTGQSANGVYFTAQNDGRVKASGTAVTQGWTYINRSFTLPYNGIDAGDQILLYGSAQLYVRFYDDTYAQVGSAVTRQPSNTATTTVPSSATKMEIYVYTGYTYPSAGQTVNETLEFYISKDLTFTSWTPYTNICPISGWDEVETVVSGKNLIDQSAYTWLDATSYSNGVFTAETLSTFSSAMVRLYKNGTVVNTINKAPTEGSRVSINVTVDDTWDVCFIGYRMGGASNVGGSFNKPIVADGTYTVSFMADKLPSTSVYGKFSNIQFEQGSTATAYEPYQGQTYTATLPTTVYGGTVDVVNGTLTVDRAYQLLDGTEVWSMPATSYFALPKQNLVNDNARATIICDKFEGDSWQRISGLSLDNVVGVVGGATIRFHYSAITSVADWKTWLASNNTAICYELATPTTIQCDPQTVQTLMGDNNVWGGGSVEVTYNIPITNLLVKRQDVADVSGTWLTLHSQPITQASDMDFTFIDFLNQYGKTYKYALVPLLTQTQSGVEVEVEGGYTVSDEVQSVFDGVFIADSTGLQKCKANVGYGDVDMNQSVGTITPIGAKYPVVITNSKNQYHNGSISGTIVPDDYYFNGNLSRIDMVNKRNELEQFLTNKRAKIIKDWNSNIWLVMIIDNINCSFDNNYGMGMVNFNASWIEVGDPTNQQDLQAAGLIDVGGV